MWSGTAWNGASCFCRWCHSKRPSFKQGAGPRKSAKMWLLGELPLHCHYGRQAMNLLHKRWVTAQSYTYFIQPPGFGFCLSESVKLQRSIAKCAPTALNVAWVCTFYLQSLLPPPIAERAKLGGEVRWGARRAEVGRG